jgi:hypothetical protein
MENELDQAKRRVTEGRRLIAAQEDLIFLQAWCSFTATTHWATPGRKRPGRNRQTLVSIRQAADQRLVIRGSRGRESAVHFLLQEQGAGQSRSWR